MQQARRFGSISKAMEAAGLATKQSQSKEAKVSPMIRATIIRIESSNWTWLSQFTRGPRQASKRVALRSSDERVWLLGNRTFYAGVSVRDVGRFRDLSPERIKQQLRRLCTTGYDLGAKVNQDRDRALYDAARQHFVAGATHSLRQVSTG